jgi:hypothetical protein
MLVYHMIMSVLYFFFHLFNANLHGDRSWPRARVSLFKQRPIAVMLTSFIRQCYFFPLQVPECFQFIGR